MCAPVSACTSVCESVCVYSLTILALDFLYLWLFYAAIFLYFSTLLAVTNTFQQRPLGRTGIFHVLPGMWIDAT